MLIIFKILVFFVAILVSILLIEYAIEKIMFNLRKNNALFNIQHEHGNVTFLDAWLFGLTLVFWSIFYGLKIILTFSNYYRITNTKQQ